MERTAIHAIDNRTIIITHGSGASTIHGGGTAEEPAMAAAEEAMARIVVERLKDIEKKIDDVAKSMERDRLKWRRDKEDMVRALVSETNTHVTAAKAEMSAGMSSVAAAAVHLAPRARTTPSGCLSDTDHRENQSELEAMPNMSVEDAVKANQKIKGRVKKWFIEKKYGFVETPCGTDVFVHSDSIKGHDFLIHGESVVMQVMVDPHK